MIEKSGIELIIEERVKQIAKYHYHGMHDVLYTNKELLFAALAYLNEALYGGNVGIEDWPWDIKYFKNEGYIESLKKAGALIAAELDRIQLEKDENTD